MEQIEAYRQIVQLQSEIVKISERNSDLKRKCARLESELTERRVFPEPLTDWASSPPQEGQPMPVIPWASRRNFARQAQRLLEFLMPRWST